MQGGKLPTRWENPCTSEIAWAAGLFEGEGCFAVCTSQKGYKQRVAQLAMTDKDVVERFHVILGVGSVCKYRPSHNGIKALYVWKTGSAETVQHVVAVLWNHLGQRRKEQAIKVLN